jgi:hypothetical protein
VGRLLEVDLFQGFHPWQARVLHAQLDRAAFALQHADLRDSRNQLPFDSDVQANMNRQIDISTPTPGRQQPLWEQRGVKAGAFAQRP